LYINKISKWTKFEFEQIRNMNKTLIWTKFKTEQISKLKKKSDLIKFQIWTIFKSKKKGLTKFETEHKIQKRNVYIQKLFKFENCSNFKNVLRGKTGKPREKTTVTKTMKN
jgi:hypothetical protein